MPRPQAGQYSPLGDVQRAQDLAKQGVEGYGETLRVPLMREIGTALGGLNSIGALRSGGTTQALGDISQNYTAQIGSYAKMAAGEATNAGLEANRQREQRRQFDAENRRRSRASLFGAIGTALGAGIGFFAGAGPAGAVAGAKAGRAVGSSFGGGAGSGSSDTSGAGYA